jgi:hypothetical protein
MGGAANALYCGYPFLRLHCHHHSPFWINNDDDMDGAVNGVWWIDLMTQTAVHSQIGTDSLLV